MDKVLVFFPHNPVPCQSGAHARLHSVLRCLQRLPVEVHLASAKFTSEMPWTESSITTLEGQGVQVHLAPKRPRWRLAPKNNSFSALEAQVCPASLRRFFRSLVDQIEPQGIYIFYTLWKKLIPEKFDGHRWLDTQDLLSRNLQLRDRLQGHFPTTGSPDRILPRAYNGHPVGGTPPLDPREFTGLDHTLLLLLSGKEKKEIEELYPTLHTAHFPLAHPTRRRISSCDRTPVLLASHNVFNRQGLTFFMKRVLPLILEEVPEFQFRLYGSLNAFAPVHAALLPHPGTEPLEAVFEGAAFSLCPAYEGTGEQTKILDSLALGVPVIAMKSRSRGTLLTDGVNGFKVSNARGFAQRCIRLWNDRQECRQMGIAAQQATAQFSEGQLVHQMRSLWHSAPVH